MVQPASTVRFQMLTQRVWIRAGKVFTCFLKSPASEEAYSHWLHLFDLSPECVFKCVLKWLA